MFGFANLNDIPRNGVYVWTVLSPRRPTSPAPSRRRSLRRPLDLQHPDQITSQEGSSLPEYRFAGRYRGIYFVDGGHEAELRDLVGEPADQPVAALL